MKKTMKSFFAIALAAFAFTACSDVPEPEGYNNRSGDGLQVFEPEGDGLSAATAYNVAMLVKITDEGNVPTGTVYAKGYVAEFNTSGNNAFNPTYGNLTYYITDSQSGSSTKFYVYRGKGLGNKAFSSADDLKVGDEVIICGELTTYNGAYQFGSGNYLVSLNGQTEGGGTTVVGDPTGTGTAADPFNIAGILNATKDLASGSTTTEDYYTKGYVAEINTSGNNAFNPTYGNITYYITDDKEGTGTKFYVYRGLGLDGNKFTSADDLKVGDEVIVGGKVTNYSGTIEYAQGSKLVKLNDKTATGGGEVTPGTPAGNGTEASPFNVAAAVAKCKEVGTTASTESYYIKGIADADYEVGSYNNVELSIVDEAGATEKFLLYRLKDKDGKGIKQGYKIAKGAEIIVYGPVVNYKGNTPETATGAYLVSVNGQTPELKEDGDNTGGGSTGGGDAVTSLTNGDFETWADGLPTGWKSASTASSATLEQSTDAHGGSYAVLVKGDASANKRLASQEITLAAGSYTFSFWVKPTSTNVAQVRPGYVPVTDGKAGSYAYGNYATLAAGWQQVSYDFTLAAETTVCLVVMNPKKSSYSSGEDVLIDDATLTKN